MADDMEDEMMAQEMDSSEDVDMRNGPDSMPQKQQEHPGNDMQENSRGGMPGNDMQDNTGMQNNENMPMGDMGMQNEMSMQGDMPVGMQNDMPMGMHSEMGNMGMPHQNEMGGGFPHDGMGRGGFNRFGPPGPMRGRGGFMGPRGPPRLANSLPLSPLSVLSFCTLSLLKPPAPWSIPWILDPEVLLPFYSFCFLPLP